MPCDQIRSPSRACRGLFGPRPSRADDPEARAIVAHEAPSVLRRAGRTRFDVAARAAAFVAGVVPVDGVAVKPWAIDAVLGGCHRLPADRCSADRCAQARRRIRNCVPRRGRDRGDGRETRRCAVCVEHCVRMAASDRAIASPHGSPLDALSGCAMPYKIPELADAHGWSCRAWFSGARFPDASQIEIARYRTQRKSANLAGFRTSDPLSRMMAIGCANGIPCTAAMLFEAELATRVRKMLDAV